MFCHITANWRGRRPIIREVVVNLIGSTTTQGIHIKAFLDENMCAPGIKVSDEELATQVIERDEFHGEWNCRLRRVIRLPESNYSSYFCLIPKSGSLLPTWHSLTEEVLTSEKVGSQNLDDAAVRQYSKLAAGATYVLLELKAQVKTRPMMTQLHPGKPTVVAGIQAKVSRQV